MLLVGFLLLASLVLRTRALGASLWMDEGLSIGIASQPFFDIPGVLRQDGSPPLYYLMLSVWMDLVGNGPADTQGLSVAISLLSIPLGLWAGWSLFGRRAGLICAALAAFNPFLTYYAQETRMYSLLAVLSLAVTALFLHVFVYGRRRYLPVFSVAIALILYTHSWGIFLTVGTLLALAPLLYAAQDRRATFKDATLAYGFAFLLYLPWIPTLLYQATHTGAPWLDPPRFGVVVQIAKGLLGGGTVSVALLLAAGSAIAALLATRDSEHKHERDAMIAVLSIGVGTLAFAWLFSQLSPAWTTRYLGVALGPIFLLSAYGLSRAGYLGLVRARDRARHLGHPEDRRAEEQVKRLRPRRRGEGQAAARRSCDHPPARAGAADGLHAATRARRGHPAGGGQDTGRDGLARLAGEARGCHSRQEPHAAP